MITVTVNPKDTIYKSQVLQPTSPHSPLNLPLACGLSAPPLLRYRRPHRSYPLLSTRRHHRPLHHSPPSPYTLHIAVHSPPLHCCRRPHRRCPHHRSPFAAVTVLSPSTPTTRKQTNSHSTSFSRCWIRCKTQSCTLNTYPTRISRLTETTPPPLVGILR